MKIFEKSEWMVVDVLKKTLLTHYRKKRLAGRSDPHLLFHFVCFLQREDLVELSPDDQHILSVVN
jgi:hypothetical protein